MTAVAFVNKASVPVTVVPETLVVPTTVAPVIKGERIFTPPVIVAPDIVPLVSTFWILPVPETTNPVCTVKFPTSSAGVSTSAKTPVVALTVIPVMVVPLIVPPVIEVNCAEVPVVVTPVSLV